MSMSINEHPEYREPIIHNRVNYGEKLYTLSEVEELLSRQRDLCESRYMDCVGEPLIEVAKAIREAEFKF